MPKGLILIAEDDVNLSEILKTKLSSLGYDVLTAHNGEDAEKFIMEQKPDVSLLDIMMPKKSGLEVLEAASKNPETKDLTKFMLSNLGQKKDMDKAQELGAKEYIVKANVSLGQIVEKIDQFLKANPPKERAAPPPPPPKPAEEKKPTPPIPVVSPTAAVPGSLNGAPVIPQAAPPGMQFPAFSAQPNGQNGNGQTMSYQIVPPQGTNGQTPTVVYNINFTFLPPSGQPAPSQQTLPFLPNTNPPQP